MIIQRLLGCCALIGFSAGFAIAANPPATESRQPLNTMGWPQPMDQESTWKVLPPTKSGEREALPIWARMLAREMPKTAAAFLELDRAQRTAGPVPANLRAAMRWAAARANHCQYTMAMAKGDCSKAGVTEAQWQGLEKGDFSGWSDAEKHAIKFAIAMTLDSANYPDEDFSKLVAFFNDRIAASMVLHMAYANFQDRLLLCLGVPVEPTYLPPIQVVFDPEGLVNSTTPPTKPANASTAATTSPAAKDVVADEKTNTWLPYDQLQAKLQEQRDRSSRLPPVDWSLIAPKLPAGLMDKPSKIVWYQLAFGYADELAVPFEIYMRTAGSEISKNWDRIFGNSIFWMVTDAMKCPYCMGHCEMNWEVAGLNAEQIAERSKILAGDDWSSFTEPQQHALAFARKLTQSPWTVDRKDLDVLRHGFGDQRALFIVVNASRYNYMTRISNGFQLTLESENVFWDYYKMPTPTTVASAGDEQARPVPVTRPEMKRLLEDMKNRKTRIPLPELTAEEKVKEKEDPRTYGYEGRLRSLYAPATEAMTYLSFAGTPQSIISANTPPQNSGNARPRPTIPPDPVTTLGYPFKTRLFWIASRANNCQYCLGHQESKLLATGMLEDDLARLDTDWESFPEAERVAFALARRITLEPHLLSDADIDACRPHYTDLQIIEMIASVSGNNAINRWKEGIGVPQSSNGGNFGRAQQASAATQPTATPATEEHSYLTATSEKFQATASKVAPIFDAIEAGKVTAPTRANRPKLESRDESLKQLELVRHRKPRLPLADDAKTRESMGDLVTSETQPQWIRLVGYFPVAGKRLVAGVKTAEECDALSPLLKNQIAWVTARQDRAWYAAALARDSMLAAGQTDDAIFDLDDLDKSKVADADKAILVLAKNLAASPVVLTDSQVAEAVKLAGPKATLQAVHYVAFRSLFNRLTEAAGLGVED